MEKHIHSFGFDKKFIGKRGLKRDPIEGERGFSIEIIVDEVETNFPLYMSIQKQFFYLVVANRIGGFMRHILTIKNYLLFENTFFSYDDPHVSKSSFSDV